MIRGYFGIGAERISKPLNFGAVLRTGHAFGASFAFTVGAHQRVRDMRYADTAKSSLHLPVYEWASIDALKLPKGCALVGVEIVEDAVSLPSFRHPTRAAYILGPEKGDLSLNARALCSHVVKIPTKFCVNLSVAAAIILYDRMISLGGFPERPVAPGGPVDCAAWDRPRALRR